MIDPQILSKNAAGTYRFLYDQSQVVSVPADQTRLIVGFSKKGPFNTPVFCPDTQFFKQVFGDIDRSLEKKDSYFHRSCLAALQRGPILAMNLLRLDDDVDVIEYIKLATSATPNIQSNSGATASYSGFFNTDKFYFPEAESFLNNVGASSTYSGSTTNDLFDITNVGKDPVSVIIRKAAAENVSGFNVTAEEWYGNANVPGYLHKDSLISDFMVDVFVIEGNFGGDFSLTNPYERFESDPTFQEYFDKNKGIKRKRVSTDNTDTYLTQFFNEDEVNLIARYTGSLLPNFVDQLGNDLYIENLVNRDTATSGVMIAINEDLFDEETMLDGRSGGLDLIGHNLEYVQSTSSQPTVNFLSYQETIVSDLSYSREETTPNTYQVATGDLISVSSNTAGDIQIEIQGSEGDTLYDAMATLTANVAGTTVGSFIKTNDGVGTEYYVPVIAINVTDSLITVTLSGENVTTSDFDVSTGSTITYLYSTDIDQVVQKWNGTVTTAAIVGVSGSDIYDAYSNGILTDGDEGLFGVDASTAEQMFFDFNATDYAYIHDGTPTAAGTVILISDSDYYLPAVEVTAYEDVTLSTQITTVADFTIDSSTKVFFESDGSTAYASNVFGVHTLKGSLNQSFDIIADSSTDSGLKPNQVLISTTEAGSDIVVGNYLVNSSGTVDQPYSRLTRINEVKGGQTTTNFSSIPSGTTALLVTTQSEIEIREIGGSPSTRSVEMYEPVDKWVEYFNIFTLDGFSLRSNYHLPNGTNDRQNEILTDTLSNTNLFNGLIDREVINFRYIVDTFGNGIEANSKEIYFRLAKERKDAFALVNAPSAKDFKNSTDPSFVDARGGLDARLISTGGDLTLNPTVRYSLPATNLGAIWGAFFFPFVTVRDSGRNINVPPAAYVSNNFIDKYANGLPWSLVAGIRRGVISAAGVVGLEINLSDSDREYLEPFGLNPIVFKNNAGPTIFANRTAKQTTKSALSSINVMEAIIFIQDGVEEILKNYLFQINTAQTRLEIKTLVDNFLRNVQDDGGIFDFNTVMDRTNNTNEIIDANKGIIDIYIEPVRGMEQLFQRLTVLRTGAISTGGFQ